MLSSGHGSLVGRARGSARAGPISTGPALMQRLVMSPGRGPQPARYQQGGQPQELEKEAAKIQKRVEEQAESVSKEIEHKVEAAAETVTHKATGFLSDAKTQSVALGTLASITAAVSLFGVVAPSTLASIAFQLPGDAVVDSLVRIAGAALLASATTKYTLKEAAVRNQLHLPTFQRLSYGVMLCGLAWAAVIAQAVSVRTPALAALAGTPALLSILLGGRIFGLYKQDSLLSIPKHLVAGVASVFVPKNAVAAGYSVLTLGTAAMAAMLLGTSVGSDMHVFGGQAGPVAVFLRRGTGAAALLMTLMAYSLKDAADRQKLGATSFRWLNLGLATSFLIMVMTLATGPQAFTTPAWAMLGAKLAAFAYTSFNYVRNVPARA